jgi:hypothetical protein
VIRVDIKPELLTWARERAGLETDALAHRFPKLAAWQRGTSADVSVLEREIDHLVYALYGLTPEEIQIVEESAQKK